MTSIKFTGADGQDIDTINGDTQFRITLDTGRTDGPDTLDVVFKWDDGDDSDTFTITKMEDGRWKMEDGTYSSTDPLDPYRGFLASFETAHDEGDAEALLGSPAAVVVDIHGEPQCRSYLNRVVGSIAAVVLLDGRPDSPWTFADVDGGDPETPARRSISCH